MEYTEMRIKGHVGTKDYSMLAAAPPHSFPYAHTRAFENVEFDVYCTCIYNNEMLEVFKHYARNSTDL
jgi:hypothetical protein